MNNFSSFDLYNNINLKSINEFTPNLNNINPELNNYKTICNVKDKNLVNGKIYIPTIKNPNSLLVQSKKVEQIKNNGEIIQVNDDKINKSTSKIYRTIYPKEILNNNNTHAHLTLNRSNENQQNISHYQYPDYSEKNINFDEINESNFLHYTPTQATNNNIEINDFDESNYYTVQIINNNNYNNNYSNNFNNYDNNYDNYNDNYNDNNNFNNYDNYYDNYYANYNDNNYDNNYDNYNISNDNITNNNNNEVDNKTENNNTNFQINSIDDLSKKTTKKNGKITEEELKKTEAEGRAIVRYSRTATVYAHLARKRGTTNRGPIIDNLQHNHYSKNKNIAENENSNIRLRPLRPQETNLISTTQNHASYSCNHIPIPPILNQIPNKKQKINDKEEEDINNNNINYNRNFSNCYNYYNNFNNYTINYDDKNNNNNNNNIDDDNYKILDLIKPDVLKNLKTPENLTQSKPKKNNQINKFKFIDQTTSIYNKSKNYHHKNHNY